MEHYKVVRFKTGESVLCTMPVDLKSPMGETWIHMSNPVQIIPQQETRQKTHRGKVHEVIGETFILKPWMGLSNTEDFHVSADFILTIGDLKNNIKEYYASYVTRAHEADLREQDSEAADSLLRDVSGGKLNIIDELTIEEQYDGSDEEGTR